MPSSKKNEEYKRKWNERENKRPRYNQAAASLRGGRQAAGRTPKTRMPDIGDEHKQVQGQRNMSQNFRISETCNHKLRMETLPVGERCFSGTDATCIAVLLL